MSIVKENNRGRGLRSGATAVAVGLPHDGLTLLYNRYSYSIFQKLFDVFSRRPRFLHISHTDMYVGTVTNSCYCYDSENIYVIQDTSI